MAERTPAPSQARRAMCLLREWADFADIGSGARLHANGKCMSLGGGECDCPLRATRDLLSEARHG